MNIKNLQRNYDALTMKERLILLDMAESRNDENEIKAIVSASPKQNWRVCDFVESKEGLLKLRLVNLIQRLHRQRNFMFFLRFANDDTASRFFPMACFEAYLYCVDLEAERIIFDELGVNQEVWNEREKQIFDLGTEHYLVDDLIQAMTFDEQEAKEFISQHAKEKGIENATVDYTVENRVKTIREVLSDGDLSELYKG